MDDNKLATSPKEPQSLNSRRKHGGWRTFPFFIGMVAGLSLASAGIVGNLIVYLIQEFNIKSINAAQIVNVVVGSSNLVPLVAAIVADSFFGSFSVAFASSCVSLLGTVILFLTATINSLKPHPCNGSSSTCKPPTEIQYTVLYISIVLISIGFGGSRFTSASLGANQFDKPEHQGIFFNWFFFAFYVASGAALTGVIYIEDNFGWALGFGVCAVATFLSVVVFLSGYGFYRNDKPNGSAVLDLGRVFVASLRKGKWKHSSRMEDYYTGATGYDVVVQILPPITPGKRLRFFNRAALITDADLNSDNTIKRSSWRLCTVQQVEDFKKIIGILPLWTSSIFLATPIAIQSSLTVLQALVMDRSLGSHFKIPAGSVSVIILVSTAIFLTFLDRLILPGWHKVTGKSPTPLQRIGVGHVLNVLGMVASALVESKRLKLGHEHVSMSVLWLFPQLVLVGIGEAFHFPGQVTFYYQQFPQSLRTTSTAMISMLIGIAFYLSTALIDQVRRSTEWLPDDINHGKVDNVYWMCVLFGGINFVYYLLCSISYKYENV
ncbi:protein NRT1/ PTR FAMILY 2.6-like [Vicia villosa]|uniref:protein NRT1/ PTR FAMILY 2.6-like n=1 Tax=Vicia villosa TaxID=3911 RepID=UPI00273B76B7|nr:protein NRT1/ PTR FAMILY 2.6-like [Vicia villosa]